MLLTEFNPNAIRSEFPLLTREVNGHPLVYLDNAATTQKPRAVIEALEAVYTRYNANIHRGVHTLSQEATQAYEEARAAAAQHIGAPERESVIFTSGATAGLNLLANLLADRYLLEGDTVLVSEMEHHSDLVPWQLNAPRKGAKVVKIPMADDGALDLEQLQALLHRERVKIVAVAHVSNVLGRVNPVAEIARMAHAHGALVVVDGAQGVKHGRVDVQELGADFYAFSGHKMLSPMGIGVLYGKYDILDAMPPFLFGGDMIEYVGEQETTYAELPAKFEAGTQNVSGASGLIAAIDYLEKVGFDRIEAIERDLISYALPKLRELPFVELYGCDSKRDNKTGIITFNVKDIHPHDVASILDSYGVAIRAGHHCAQPLMRYLGQNATCRASFYLYNTHEDVDQFIDALKKVRGVLGYGD